MLETLKGIKESLISISKCLNYLIHPTKIFIDIWHWTLSMSYWICLFLAILSILNYILGVKKFSKLLPVSICTYALIQALGTI